MKRKTRFLLGFMLLVMGIFCCTSTTYAKARLVSLKFNKTYKTDITGDGKADRLKIVEKNIQADYPAQCHRIIYINGKKVADLQSYGTQPVYYYKTGTSNEYLIVGTHYKGGCTDYTVYHGRKNLTRIGVLPSDYFTGKLSLSGNNIKYNTYAKGGYITKYCVVSKVNNGRVSLASRNAKVTGRKYVTAQTAFRTYKSVNSTTPDGIRIRPNQKLKITKVYLKKTFNYYYAPYYKVYVNGRYTWINPYMSQYLYY